MVPGKKAKKKSKTYSELLNPEYSSTMDDLPQVALVAGVVVLAAEGFMFSRRRWLHLCFDHFRSSPFVSVGALAYGCWQRSLSSYWVRRILWRCGK